MRELYSTLSSTSRERIATRYEKQARNYLTMLTIASIMALALSFKTRPSLLVQ